VRRIAFALLLLAAIPHAQAARIPPGAPSAEAAWTQAREAYRRGDFRTYITTIAPEAHDECLCQMSKLLSAAIGAEALEAEEGLDDLNEILERHGVLNYEAPAHRADSLNVPGLWGRAALGRIRDKVGLYQDVMRYMRKEKVGPELPPLFALRMSNQKDQEFLRAAMPESGIGLLDELPSLRNAEAIAVGEGVPIPTRICFDELPDFARPRSKTAPFSTAWAQEVSSDSFLQSVVSRWRNQR